MYKTMIVNSTSGNQKNPKDYSSSNPVQTPSTLTAEEPSTIRQVQLPSTVVRQIFCTSPEVSAITSNDGIGNKKELISGSSIKYSNKLSSTSRENLHVTADHSFQEPERDISQTDQTVMDFDSDDSVADPMYERPAIENTPDSDSSEEEQRTQRKGRKRLGNPEAWKKNMKKSAKHAGTEYVVTKTNRIAKSKTLKDPCAHSCKLKCTTKISEEKRQNIHAEFWNSRKNFETRRQFIASHVEQVQIQRVRERIGHRRGQRKHMNKYYFEVNGLKVLVCKTFFFLIL